MSPTQTSTQRVPPSNPSQPGTAQWIYDEIMRHIEPDLLTTRVIHLDEIYKNETKEEGLKRMACYEKAFQIFDAAAAGFEKDFHAGLLAMRKGAREKAMQEEKQTEDQNVQNIESKFNET
jgi:hypothetical protein